MKIALIYTPRSGSTSILKYFSNVKKDYTCYNEPWFEWMVENFHKTYVPYEEIIKKDNIFVKSAYRTLPVDIEKIISDFDIVLFLLRKNKKEQVESSILTHKQESFLDNTKKDYWVDLITEDEFKEFNDRYDFLNDTLTEASVKYNKKLFYYEDLYYGDFSPLFKELGVEYNDEYFKKFLDTGNRYRQKDTKTKSDKSLI